MNIAWGASIALFIGAWGLLWVLRRDTLKRGKTEEDNAILEATNEALSNRPISDADLVAKLRSRAADERKVLRQP